MVFKAIAPVLGLAQFELLDHGAHSAIQHEDALAQQLRQLLGARVWLTGGARLSIAVQLHEW